MSEYKNCPVCGGEFDYLYGENKPPYAKCHNCGLEMSIKNINRRVIQWVPVGERLPDGIKPEGEIVATYWCRVVSKVEPHHEWCVPVHFIDGKFWGWGNEEITHWLDDHTKWEDK
jgi:hypothetical protein